jgi:hypothetical protein
MKKGVKEAGDRSPRYFMIVIASEAYSPVLVTGAAISGRGCPHYLLL